jgi:hypothetical protein
MSAIELSDAVTLVFNTVLGRITLGIEEDEEKDEPADRAYWLSRASTDTLAITDSLLNVIPDVALKYNKHYIGLAHGGVANNYVVLRPRRRSHVVAEFRIDRSDELDERLEGAGFDMLTYQTRYGQYRIQISQDDLELRGDLLRELVQMAQATERRL